MGFRSVLLLLVSGLLLAAVASGAPAAPAPDVLRPAGKGLQAAIDAARPGDVIELPRGTWHGPVVIDKALTLRGKGGVIEGGGKGTVIRVEAAHVLLDGLVVRGSGKNLSGPDACIYLTPKATGTRVEHTRLSDCGFGIWVHETPRARLIGNRIAGSFEGSRSDRGNGIQLFNAQHLRVLDNVITGGRDGIYVSATEYSLIARNHIKRTRYGVHYMFAYNNTLRGNVSNDNFGGFALMESHHIKAIDNVAMDNTEHGILFRDVEYCTITGNRIEHNGQGMFFFSSTQNRIENNRLLHNEVGAKIWAGSLRNKVEGNVFVGNRQQVQYVGNQDLVWGTADRGNFWGDYLGWDQNGDGIGDRPYRVDSFTTHLLGSYPSAALLMQSPALELLSHLAEKLPILRVPTVIDERPLTRRPAP